MTIEMYDKRLNDIIDKFEEQITGLAQRVISELEPAVNGLVEDETIPTYLKMATLNAISKRMEKLGA